MGEGEENVSMRSREMGMGYIEGDPGFAGRFYLRVFVLYCSIRGQIHKLKLCHALQQTKNLAPHHIECSLTRNSRQLFLTNLFSIHSSFDWIFFFFFWFDVEGSGVLRSIILETMMWMTSTQFLGFAAEGKNPQGHIL